MFIHTAQPEAGQVGQQAGHAPQRDLTGCEALQVELVRVLSAHVQELPCNRVGSSSLRLGHRPPP
eukprot:8338938-Lingulodinium_polyedra.AAC.1